jgi:hypothetical protein
VEVTAEFMIDNAMISLIIHLVELINTI